MTTHLKEVVKKNEPTRETPIFFPNMVIDAALRQVVDHQNFYLYGEHGIGKTATARYAEWTLNQAGYPAVYMDMAFSPAEKKLLQADGSAIGKASATLGESNQLPQINDKWEERNRRERLLVGMKVLQPLKAFCMEHAVKSRKYGEITLTSNFTFEDLQEAIEEAHGGRRLILIMDNFEALYEPFIYDARYGVFALIHSTFGSRAGVLLFGEHPGESPRMGRTYGSPLLNSIAKDELPGLTKDEAEELLHQQYGQEIENTEVLLSNAAISRERGETTYNPGLLLQAKAVMERLEQRMGDKREVEKLADLVPDSLPGSEATRNYGETDAILMRTISSQIDRHNLTPHEEDLSRDGANVGFSKYWERATPTVRSSRVQNSIVDISSQILQWIDGWMGEAERDHDVDLTQPIFPQVIHQKMAECNGNVQSEQFRNWWQDLDHFIRLLKIKGSSVMINMAEQEGVQSGDLWLRMLKQLYEKYRVSPHFISKLFHPYDIDFSVFAPTYRDQVFREFYEHGVYLHILKDYGPELLEGSDASVVRYRLNIPVSRSDIFLLPGHRLLSDRVECTFNTGRISPGRPIRYDSVKFVVQVQDVQSHTTRDLVLSALEFMPSPDDMDTIKHDTKTGAQASFSHNLAEQGYLLTTAKPPPQTLGKPWKRNVLRKQGLAVYLPPTTFDAYRLSNQEIYPFMAKMAVGESASFDHNVIKNVADMLLVGLYNWHLQPSSDNNRLLLDPKVIGLLRLLSQRLDPNRAEPEVIHATMAVIRQAFLLDFPAAFDFLEQTGFIRFFRISKEDYRTWRYVADDIRHSTQYHSFKTVVEQAKKNNHGVLSLKVANRLLRQNYEKAMQITRRVATFHFDHIKSDARLFEYITEIPYFRELLHEEQWGADIVLDRPQEGDEGLFAALKREVTDYPIHGYVVLEEGQADSEERGYCGKILHLSKYPRSADCGEIPLSQLEAQAASVSSQLNLKGGVNRELPSSKPKFRAIVSRIHFSPVDGKTYRYGFKGYKKYLMREIDRTGLASSLSYAIKPAEMVTVWPDGTGRWESIIVVEGDMEILPCVYSLADYCQIDRVRVELLHEKKAYIVETLYALDSTLDKE